MTSAAIEGFVDRLGDRFRIQSRTGDPLEVFCPRGELSGESSFAPSVALRFRQMATMTHRGCARIVRVGHLPAPDGRFAVVSEAVDGWRLSDVLDAVESRLIRAVQPCHPGVIGDKGLPCAVHILYFAAKDKSPMSAGIIGHDYGR